MTSTVPGIVVSDAAIDAAFHAGEGDPELEFHALNDAGVGSSPAVGRVAAIALIEAVAPHLIRDWVRTVLALYPHVLPGQLAELADGLLPEEAT